MHNVTYDPAIEHKSIVPRFRLEIFNSSFSVVHPQLDIASQAYSNWAGRGPSVAEDESQPQS